MKCAILGNGPSRALYTGDAAYDYVISTNIPWTSSNMTIVMDEDIIIEWNKNRNLIKVPTYFSSKAWMFADSIKFRSYILENNLYIGIFEIPKDGPSIRYSSGHFAALKAIDMGYTELDLYGFDSYFANSIESYTRQFVICSPANNAERWKTLWNQLIYKHKGVTFNFIKE